MKLVSKIEFSKIACVTHQAISLAVKKGKIPTVKQGKRHKIDLHDPLVNEYIRGSNSSRLRARGETPPKTIKPDDEVSNDVFSEPSTEAEGKISKNEADRQKTIAQLEEIRLKNAEKRDEVVPRDLVRQVFQKIYTVDVTELRVMSGKLAPKLSAIAGVDDPDITTKMNEAIDTEVLRSLQHIKQIINDFLAGLKEGGEIV